MNGMHCMALGAFMMAAVTKHHGDSFWFAYFALGVVNSLISHYTSKH